MHYHKIAVAIDGSEPSNNALIEAVQLAKQLNATLSLIHIIDGFVDYNFATGLDFDAYLEARKALADEILEKSKEISHQQHVKTEAHVIENLYDPKRISEKLFYTIENLKPDLLVMGTHGHRGFNAIFLGSVAEQTIRIAPIPVLLIGPKCPAKREVTPYQKITVAIDGSKHSRVALMEAINLSKALSAKLELIHVVHEMPVHLPMGFHLAEEQAYLKKHGQSFLDQMSEIAQNNGVLSETKLLEIKLEGKSTAEVLIEELQMTKTSLLIMGTHGWRGLNRFLLGSVAVETVHTACVPILIVTSRTR